MSNTDFEDPTPVDFAARRAQAVVATSGDADPDKAARANTISRAIGVPPAAVFENMEQYESQYKDTLTSGIVKGNSYLQDYINSHPLAAKVSNDDYGQLDSVSQAVDKMGPGQSILSAGIKGFTENAQLGELNEEYKDLSNLLASNPLFANFFVRQATLAGATSIALPMRLASGLFGGAAAGIAEAYKQAGGSEAEANRLTRDLITFAQVGLSGQAGLHGPVAPEVHAAIAEVAKAGRAVEPYVSAGKEPPVGIHPVVDEFKTEQAKVDADNLAEALKESVKSATRERDPELFTSFIAQHTDGEIGISADAVRKLYRDKPPIPGDGPLGFIPDLADQLARAEATGGDVQVKIADWLGKVDPDVAKELKDHIRARPEGVTLEEAKELTPPEGVPVEPVEGVRQAAGLQGIQERKLELRRVDTSQDNTRSSNSFDIMQDNKTIGQLDLGIENEGKRIYIDDVRLSDTNTPHDELAAANKLGPAAIRELLAQLKEQFPDAEELTGFRASGARWLSGKGSHAPDEINKPSIDLTKIKPRAKAPEHEAPGLLQRAKEALVGKSEEAQAAEAKAMEERELFDKASAIGMTVVQYKRYARLIQKRAAKDAEAASKRVLAGQRRRQTAEWKANRAELRPQVRDEVLARPEVELDEMLRKGRVKLSKTDITPDQAALLPKDYLAVDGIHPADLAGLFGDVHPGALVDRLIALEQSRTQAGMKPKAHLERMVDAETDRQMEAKYGSLDKNILEEAKDQVLSETQEELLHEEVIARASDAGLQLTITKDELKAAIKDFFDRQLVRDVSSDKGLAEAGRAGRAAEMALLKGDYAEAFRQKQRQFNAFTMATYAKKFEKGQAQFEKLAKQSAPRERAGVEQSYQNWIRDILIRLGEIDSRVAAQDLAKAISESDHQTIADFVDHKQLFDLREVPVADFLKEQGFGTKTENLTTAQFQAMHDSLKTLLKNGRDELKIGKEGEQADLEVVKTEMINQLRQFAVKEYDAKGGRWLTPYIPPKQASQIRGYGYAHLQMETLFNRLDRGNPWGVFSQKVMRPLIEAANNERALEKEYAAKYRALADFPLIKGDIPNDILMDPYSVQLGVAEPIRMSDENLRALILNMGNKSNFDKLARGYNVNPEMLRAWVHSVSTKEHWDWAQAYGDIFKEFEEKHIAPMGRRLSGIAPETIPLEPIETPFGTYKGWYYPVIYHPLWEGTSRKLMGGDALEGPNYIRATTPQGYLEKRTGYAGPIDLSLDRGPNRLKQQIHDVAFREAVINASKIMYDKDVRAAIANHFSKEFRDMMVPYLKGIANSSSVRNDVAVLDGRMGETIRQNTIAVLVGMNPGTVAKHSLTALYQSIHEVGGKEFGHAVASLFSKDDITGDTNAQFAMKNSQELQGRIRNMQEVLKGGSENLFGKPTWRDIMIHAGSYPVGISDLASAVPTWLAQYKKTLEQTGMHGDAVYMADRAVRRAHGSTAITNRPEIMRSGNLWFTSLYGFFNHIMNRQYEMTWQAHDAITGEGAYKDTAGQSMKLVKTPDGIYVPEKALTGAKVIPKLTSGYMAYIMIPALIEEMVTPQLSDNNESWGKWGAKAIAGELSSSWIYAREIAHAILNGRDPSAGIISTSLQTVTNVARDMSKPQPFSKQNAGRTVKNGVMLFGAARGLTNAQMGREAELMLNYMTGVDKPKGTAQWYHALRYGTSKPFK